MAIFSAQVMSVLRRVAIAVVLPITLPVSAIAATPIATGINTGDSYKESLERIEDDGRFLSIAQYASVPEMQSWEGLDKLHLTAGTLAKLRQGKPVELIVSLKAAADGMKSAEPLPSPRTREEVAANVEKIRVRTARNKQAVAQSSDWYAASPQKRAKPMFGYDSTARDDVVVKHDFSHLPVLEGRPGFM